MTPKQELETKNKILKQLEINLEFDIKLKFLRRRGISFYGGKSNQFLMAATCKITSAKFHLQTGKYQLRSLFVPMWTVSQRKGEF